MEDLDDRWWRWEWQHRWQRLLWWLCMFVLIVPGTIFSLAVWGSDTPGWAHACGVLALASMVPIGCLLFARGKWLREAGRP